MDPAAHEQIRELLPEVALGTISGKERAIAIDHLANCPECRLEVEDLSDIADDIFLLVGESEPPVGFEGRVVALIGQDRRQRRVRRILPLVAASVAASVITAMGLQMVWRDDRDLAASYRETLEVANGRYFKAVPLVHDTGSSAGTVFAYQGDPSWVFVTVEAPAADANYSVSLTTEDGQVIALKSLEVVNGHGSWGHEIPVDLEDAASIQVWQPGQGIVYVARL